MFEVRGSPILRMDGLYGPQWSNSGALECNRLCIILYDRFIYRYLYIPFTLPYRLSNIREWITINGLREEGLWGKERPEGC